MTNLDLSPRPYVSYDWGRQYERFESFALIPGNQFIATTGHQDCATHIWDLSTGVEVCEPFIQNVHTDSQGNLLTPSLPTCVTAAKRGGESKDILLLVGTVDNTVLLWTWQHDATTSTSMAEEGHMAPRIIHQGARDFSVLSIAFSSQPKPTYVAVSTSETVVRVYETFLGSSPISSPSRSTAASNSSAPLHVISFPPNAQVSHIQFSKTDPNMFAVSCYDKTLHILDARNGERKAIFPSCTSMIKALTWLPGGKGVFAEATNVHMFEYTTNSNGGGSSRRRSSYGSPTSPSSGNLLGLSSIDEAMSPTSGPPTLSLAINSPRGANLLTHPTLFIGHTKLITCLSVSPDGRFLASGSNDKTVRVWDLATRSQQGPPLVHAGYVTMVQWCPPVSDGINEDGLRLLSVSAGGDVRLYNMSYLEVEGNTETTKKAVFDLKDVVQSVRDQIMDTVEYEISNLRVTYEAKLFDIHSLLEHSRAESAEHISSLEQTLADLRAQQEGSVAELQQRISNLEQTQDKIKQRLEGLNEGHQKQFIDIKEGVREGVQRSGKLENGILDVSRKVEEKSKEVQKEVKDVKVLLEMLVKKLAPGGKHQDLFAKQ